MTQTLLIAPFPEAVSRLVSLLERHREASPVLEAELAQQRELAELMAEHRRRAEQALSAWRDALSRRWECEVGAQRAYSAAQRQIAAYYGGEPTYAQLIAPAHHGSASTPSDLLHDVGRLAASLELLLPQPHFAAEAAGQLRAAAAALAAAIERSDRCEAERRTIMTEQRIVANLYGQAYDRARRTLTRHLGEQAVALPPPPPDAAPLT